MINSFHVNEIKITAYIYRELLCARYFIPGLPAPALLTFWAQQVWGAEELPGIENHRFTLINVILTTTLYYYPSFSFLKVTHNRNTYTITHSIITHNRNTHNIKFTLLAIFKCIVQWH